MLRCRVSECSISSSETTDPSRLSQIVKYLSPWRWTKKLSSGTTWNGVVAFGADTNMKPRISSKPASFRLAWPLARATESQVCSVTVLYARDPPPALQNDQDPQGKKRSTGQTRA